MGDTKDDVVVCEYPPAPMQGDAVHHDAAPRLRQRVRLVAWDGGVDLTIDEMIFNAKAERGSGYNEWEPAEHAIHFPHGTVGDLVRALLPHLTGDDLRRVAEAMPRVAGEWSAMPRWRCWRRFRVEMGGTAGCVEQAAVRPHSNGDEWVATTAGPYEYTTHPTARAAQAACDARLRAAGVALCGEVVSDAE